VRLPLYKLKLVRSGAIAFPRIDLEQPQLAAHFFHRLIGQAVVEHAAAIFLDPLGQFTGSTIISVGDLARVEVIAREAFKAAICANASGVILGHNHPSSPSSEPSAGDIRATRRMIRAGSILGINVLDHIIVTPSSGFTSMRESGHLALWWSAAGVAKKAPTPSEPPSTSGNSSGCPQT